MLDAHEDIRELIGEARLQPTGSRSWWRLVTAAVAAWTQHLDGEEPGALADLRGLGPAFRRRLRRQWQAFIAARVRDQAMQQ